MQKLDESLLLPLPLFSLLDRAKVRAILDRATTRTHDEGITVFSEGDLAERFFLLLDGTIRVMRITTDGEQVTSLHIPAGQLFGIAQALGRSTYPATAMAACQVLVLSWPAALWHGFVADYPGFATETYRTVGVRVAEMHSRIVELSTKHVEQRVARALLRLVNQSGRKTPEGIEINFPITRQDVSEMTGTTLHTVSRLLSAWERDGVINSRRKHITVLDPHRLVVLGGA